MTSHDASVQPRVLLVDPYMAREDPMERKFVELYPSLGLLTLASYLRAHGAEVQLADLTFDRDLRRVERALAHLNPQVVGVHTKTMTFRRGVQVAALARAAGAYTVAGGPDATTRPGAYLDAGFDAVASGEGEATVVELARRVAGKENPAGHPGVITRHRGELVRGPPRRFIANLDDLPLPAWELVDMEEYLSRWARRSGERRAAVLTSRGCPFDCSWCSKPTFGRTFRQQSPERVMEEVDALRTRFGVDYIRFCDDVFGISRRWLNRLLDRMDQDGSRIKFECLARVELLKPDLLSRMRRAGLERVYVGVESGSQRMLDLMNRGTRLAHVERTAEALRREGIRQFWFLMLGYPGESIEDIEATLALFRRFSPEEYSVSIAVPVPGTRFYESVRDRLRSSGTRKHGRAGGKELLYEAAYPESLYRWEQARFEWEAALSRAHGRVSDRVLRRLSRAADHFNDHVAEPLLLGVSLRRRQRGGSDPDVLEPLPMVRPSTGTVRPPDDRVSDPF